MDSRYSHTLVIALLAVGVAAGAECQQTVVPPSADCGRLAGVIDESMLVPDGEDACLGQFEGDTGVFASFDEALGALEIEVFQDDPPCGAGEVVQLGTCGEGEYYAIRRIGQSVVTRYYDPMTRRLVGVSVGSESDSAACSDETFGIARIECDDFVLTRDVCDVPEFFFRSGFRFGPTCEDFSIAGVALVRDVADPCLCRFPGDVDMLPTYEERLQLAREGAAIGDTCTDIPTAYRAGVCNAGEVRFISVSGGFTGATSYFSAETGRLIGTASFTDVFDGLCGGETFLVDRIDVFDCQVTENLCPISD
ncbi:MAG: hypothetical protein H6818_20235 [Phycisphaerales bacterium]|nr:hypothetical protein [Phycisphaerales bacterium]